MYQAAWISLLSVFLLVVTLQDNVVTARYISNLENEASASRDRQSLGPVSIEILLN